MSRNIEKTDIVVVGAGPAGSSAARKLAKSGYDVIMLEKQQIVGQHVQCGEGVTKNINNIDPEIRLKKDHIATKIGTLQLALPNGAILPLGKRKPEVEGYIINRDKYDQFLAKLAENHGADVRTNSPVTSPVIKNGQVKGVSVYDKTNRRKYLIRSDLVVAADGVSSLIGKKAGLPVQISDDDICPCAERRLSNISVDPHTIEIWFLPEFEGLDGYAWVFPKSSTIANVGCGTTSAITKKLGVSIEDVLSRFIKKRFYDQDPKPILRMNGVVPMTTCNQLVSPGIALVGDAGRMVTPISGGGIENAIKAGILLGDVVSTTGTSFVSLKRYEMEYMIKRGLKMNTIYKLRKMFYFISSKVSPNILWMGADAMKLLFDFRGVLIDLTE